MDRHDVTEESANQTCHSGCHLYHQPRQTTYLTCNIGDRARSDLSQFDNLRYMLLDFDTSGGSLRGSVVVDNIRPVTITLDILR